jgi:hypothetical protein
LTLGAKALNGHTGEAPELGIDVDALQQITERLPWGFQPVTPTVIADQ